MFLQILTFCDKKPRKRGDLSTIYENKCLKNYEILSFLNFSNHFLIDKISDKFLIPEFLVGNAPNNIGSFFFKKPDNNALFFCSLWRCFLDDNLKGKEKFYVV